MADLFSSNNHLLEDARERYGVQETLCQETLSLCNSCKLVGSLSCWESVRKFFPLISGMRQDCLILPYAFNFLPGVQAKNCGKSRKLNKSNMN